MQIIGLLVNLVCQTRHLMVISYSLEELDPHQRQLVRSFVGWILLEVFALLLEDLQQKLLIL